MNLVSKINGLVLVLTLLASLVVTGIVAAREFSAARERHINSSMALVQSQPTLPMLIYQQDHRHLKALLANYLNSESVRYAALFDSSGNLVLEQQRDGIPPYPLASYSSLRAESSPVDLGSSQRSLGELRGNEDGGGIRDTVPFFSWGDEQVTDITVPILSMLSPLETGLTWADFSRAMEEPEDIDSLYVVGYINVGISHPYLWQQISPVILRTGLGCALIVILFLTISWIYSRSILGPLARLAKQAERVAAGQFESDAAFHAGGEARHFANMLNYIVGELNTQKSTMSVSQQLLSMKVEERNAQLSMRDQELSLAVDEVTRTREDLHRMAYFDSLTGLPNRRLFTEQLNLLMRMAIRNNNTLALLFLDLDNFKRINDSLGHSAGDLLLREVGIRLCSCMRDSDLVSHYVDTEAHIEVSRLGGDEFTVILNQIAGAESAGIVAQRLLDAMSAPVMVDGHELVITPSIGIAIGPRDAHSVEGLLKAADTAMYHAKESGKNNYLYYSEDMTATDMERLRLETDLRRAIERDELLLHFQPQVDLESGTVVGVETLIRWQHPERGLLPPLSFIPLAEEMGMIIPIGEWVLEEACGCLKTLQTAGLESPPTVAVNVSALAFTSSFVDHIAGLLDRTGINPELLELELTEGVMMDSSTATIESLRHLKNLGVGLAIDDFGTGFSSLSYLSHFPLDTLKIDRSFVVDFNKNERNRGLVVAIIAMARSLKLGIVAEGVETTEQLDFLHENGVNVIQGYLFSKPVPIEELPELLQPGYFSPQSPVVCKLEASA